MFHVCLLHWTLRSLSYTTESPPPNTMPGPQLMLKKDVMIDEWVEKEVIESPSLQKIKHKTFWRLALPRWAEKNL